MFFLGRMEQILMKMPAQPTGEKGKKQKGKRAEFRGQSLEGRGQSWRGFVNRDLVSAEKLIAKII